jgi:hypothetical protein
MCATPAIMGFSQMGDQRDLDRARGRNVSTTHHIYDTLFASNRPHGTRFILYSKSRHSLQDVCSFSHAHFGTVLGNWRPNARRKRSDQMPNALAEKHGLARLVSARRERARMQLLRQAAELLV